MRKSSVWTSLRTFNRELNSPRNRDTRYVSHDATLLYASKGELIFSEKTRFWDLEITEILREIRTLNSTERDVSQDVAHLNVKRKFNIFAFAKPISRVAAFAKSRHHFTYSSSGAVFLRVCVWARARVRVRGHCQYENIISIRLPTNTGNMMHNASSFVSRLETNVDVVGAIGLNDKTRRTVKRSGDLSI